MRTSGLRASWFDVRISWLASLEAVDQVAGHLLTVTGMAETFRRVGCGTGGVIQTAADRVRGIGQGGELQAVSSPVEVSRS